VRAVYTARTTGCTLKRRCQPGTPVAGSNDPGADDMEPPRSRVPLLAAAAAGVFAVGFILRRGSRSTATDPPDLPFAASTEGMRRCPNCGVGNLVTDFTCSNCGKRLS